MQLLGAFLLSAVVLYLPGYLANRGLRIDRFASLALAPVVTCLACTLIGVILRALNVSMPPYFALVIAIALALVLCVATYVLKLPFARCSFLDCSDGARGKIWVAAAAYVVVAGIIAIVMYVTAIDGPYSFSRNDDTTVHLSLVRSFLDTGYFSTLHASNYANLGVLGSFYPSEWHVATAVIASLLGGSVTLASNAVILALIVLVLPLIALLFMVTFFKAEKRVIAVGCLFPAAFSGFPWGFLIFGQLLPNMLSFAFVPAAMVLLARAVGRRGASGRWRSTTLLVCSLAAIAFAQPNGVFTWGIWAASYLLVGFIDGSLLGSGVSLAKRLTVATAFLLTALAVWGMLYMAPFLQSVVQCEWAALCSPAKAIAYGVGLMFSDRQGVQLVLGALVLLGFFRTLFCRKHIWLTVAYLLAFVIFTVDISTDGLLKHVLSGFWYTDFNRTGAMLAVFAMPLAAYGMEWAISGGARLLVRLSSRRLSGRSGYIVSSMVMCLALVWFQFNPIVLWLGSTHSYKPGLQVVRSQIVTRYSWDRGLTSEECEFLEKVQSLIPEGSLIINVPSDGTSWAYGVEGANVLFRRSSNDTVVLTPDESKLIRTELCNVSSSPEVRKIIIDLGAKYVVLLDDPTGESRTVSSFRYKPENWEGIESIAPETPGFKLLLSEGDMRLYEITAS